MAARVSGATLLVADAEDPELAEVAVALLCEPELEPEWEAEDPEPDKSVSRMVSEVSCGSPYLSW